MAIQLGDRIRCKITGFTGIATSRHEYLNGCIRWCVQPEGLDKDGKIRDDKVFDEPQLELANSQKATFKTAPKHPTYAGGPDRKEPRR